MSNELDQLSTTLIQPLVASEDPKSCREKQTVTETCARDTTEELGCGSPTGLNKSDMERPDRSSLLQPAGPAQETAECNKESDNKGTLFGAQFPTESHWIMNDKKYLAEVAHLIESNFCTDVNRVHVTSFIQRKKRMQLKRTKEQRDFWVEANPETDAWMVVIGEQREVFDLKAFAAAYPDIQKYLERLRKMVNVQVLPCSCPLAKVLADSKKQTGETSEQVETGDTEDMDSQGLPRRPQLSSQTYWRKIKGWRPW